MTALPDEALDASERRKHSAAEIGKLIKELALPGPALISEMSVLSHAARLMPLTDHGIDLIRKTVRRALDAELRVIAAEARAAEAERQRDQFRGEIARAWFELGVPPYLQITRSLPEQIALMRAEHDERLGEIERQRDEARAALRRERGEMTPEEATRVGGKRISIFEAAADTTRRQFLPPPATSAEG